MNPFGCTRLTYGNNRCKANPASPPKKEQRRLFFFYSDAWISHGKNRAVALQREPRYSGWRSALKCKHFRSVITQTMFATNPASPPNEKQVELLVQLVFLCRQCGDFARQKPCRCLKGRTGGGKSGFLGRFFVAGNPNYN